MYSKKYGIALFTLLLFASHLTAQVDSSLVKSTEIQEIEGRSYYIHNVVKGQTVFTIAKLYNIPTIDIYRENPETRTGIKVGQTIKIPIIVQFEDDEYEDTPYEYVYEGAPESTSNLQGTEDDTLTKLIDHKVRFGETIYRLAKKYNTSIESIYAENIESRNVIQIGQILKIRVSWDYVVKNNNASLIPKNKKVTRPGEDIEIPFKLTGYKVKLFETVYGIARKNNTTVETIYSDNPETKNGIKKGQQLNIRTQEDYAISGKDTIAELKKHVVQRKETIAGIAKRYDIDESVLKKYNPRLRNKIKSGIVLNIPIKRETAEQAKVTPEKPEIGVYTKGDLGVHLINTNHIELKPGSSSNIAVRLLNNSDVDKEFHIKVSTPYGISQLSDYSSILIEKNSNKLKIFSFYVDESTHLGEYEIGIEAMDKDANEKIANIKIPVFVQPKYDLHTEVLDPPDFIFSGDTTNIKFLIRNLSNTDVNIDATLINAKVIESKKIHINADSSTIVSIHIVTDKDVYSYTKQTVSLNTYILESTDIRSDASCIFNVIPSKKVKFDSYNRIPTKVSGLFVSNNQTGERLYGGMFDIVGQGVISERKQRLLSFHFRGPNQQGNPIIGQSDVYNLNYASRHSRVSLGDDIYKLTPLTEGSRSGRGVEYEHIIKRVSIGAFVNFPRYFPKLERVISVYSNYGIEKKLNLKIGYLNKLYVEDSSAQLGTISGETSLSSWGDLKFEYAAGTANGNFGMAYSAEVRLQYKRYRLFAIYSKADELFPGYMTNSKYLSSGITTNFDKFNLNLNYNFNHSNLALDTLYSNAPFTSNLTFTSGYGINFNHNINFSVSMRGSEDMNPVKQFHYKQYTARLGVRSRFGKFGVNAEGSIAKTENFLPLKLGEVTDSYRGSVTLQYKINKNIFTKCFASYNGGSYYLTDDYSNYFYGASIDVNWRKKFKLLFQYQNNYAVEDYYQDRSLLGLSAQYIIHRNHQIGAYINYDLRKNSLNNTVLSTSLRYTITLNIPVARKESTGGLVGKVINNGVDNVEGILLTLAGNIVYTDENGEFEIPYINMGSYFLFMDNTQTELNTIAETPGPYKIDIFPGEQTYFEVSLTKSSRVTGSLFIEEDENQNRKGFIEVKTKDIKLIIEVNKENEVFRVYTNPDGSFEFNDLRPGKWKLLVYEQGIPDNYHLVNKEYDLTLSAEETKNVDVIIRKKSRRIKFQRK